MHKCLCFNFLVQGLGILTEKHEFVFIQVFVGGTKYVHLRIYIPPSGEPVRLDGILLNKTADDPINYFDIKISQQEKC